ncbi:MAG: FAD binding domain-containing protein [Candidatus Competibacterales bacterium]
MGLTVQRYTQTAAAAAALAEQRSAKLIAGGTLVMRQVNEGNPPFDTLIRLQDPGLLQLALRGPRWTLGALVTMAQVLANPALDFLHPAAKAVGGPAVRSAATVGGNLFAPTPYGDFATALLALEATVVVHSGRATREVTLEEFLPRRDRGGQLVSQIVITRPPPRALRYLKVSRVHPKGLSLMTLAALLPGAPGRLQGVRVATGGMAATPGRVAAVERALEGQPLDPKGIDRALAVAPAAVDPPSDALASAWYRREVFPVHLKRLLLEPSP